MAVSSSEHEPLLVVLQPLWYEQRVLQALHVQKVDDFPFSCKDNTFKKDC